MMSGDNVKIDTNRLHEDLVKLRELYSKCPRKTDLRKGLIFTDVLNDILEILGRDRVDVYGVIPNIDEVIRNNNKKVNKETLEFYNFIGEELYDIYCLLFPYIELSCDEGLITVPYKDILRKYSLNDFKDIVFDFFSRFGSYEEDVARRYFEEGRIEFGYPEKEFGGGFVASNINDAGYIFTQYNKLNTRNLSTVVHEIGHAIDYKKYYDTQGMRNANVNDIFLEIPSAFFETTFAKYLKESKIDEFGGYMTLQNVLALVYVRLLDIHKYFKLREKYNHITLDSIGNVMFPRGQRIELRRAVLYSIAYYVALFANEKVDVYDKEFMRKLYSASMMRERLNLEDVVEMLGLDAEEFQNPFILRDVMKENNDEIRRRFRL